jgi:transcriptional regulator with XRE-family HTH domain
MGVIELGLIIKQRRLEKGFKTFEEFADKAHVSRQLVSSIEKGLRGREIKSSTIIRIANALEMSPTPMMEALGAQYFEPISEKAKTSLPDKHAIYKDFPFHAGSPVRPVDYFYRSYPGKASKNIEGYIVHGTCLEPTIQEGDVIIVDREGAIDNGSLIACRNLEGELHVGRLRKIADELYLENNDGRLKFEECVVAAPIIEINRRVQ